MMVNCDDYLDDKHHYYDDVTNDYKHSSSIFMQHCQAVQTGGLYSFIALLTNGIETNERTAKHGASVGTKCEVEVDNIDHTRATMVAIRTGMDYYELIVWSSITALSLVVLSKLFRNKRFCQTISLIPSNSIWGYLDLLATSEIEHSERAIMATVEKYGLLSQFHCFLQHVVLINDSKIACLALDKVRGRGLFNVIDCSASLQLRMSN